MKKYILFTVGIITTGLAVLGAWLPGLPTTIFLIIALWAFANSNKRLHNWLSNAPIFRTAMVHVKNFEQHRAVTKKVKIIAQSFAWASFCLVVILHGWYTIPALVVFLTAASCSVAMHVIPTLHLTSKTKVVS